MPPNETPEPTPSPQDATQSPTPPPIPTPPYSAPREEPPDPWKWLQRFIYQRFGFVGLFIVAVLVLVWSNWNTVKDFPVISSIVTWFSQEPLPKADPQRFAVAIAHLEYDKEQQYEGPRVSSEQKVTRCTYLFDFAIHIGKL